MIIKCIGYCPGMTIGKCYPVIKYDSASGRFEYVDDEGKRDFYWYKPGMKSDFFTHETESDNLTKILNQYL